ncbi:MAG: hypothetical protein GY847_26350 [Proteobacteria bacterium]|nr:hypothetical protein [Pseudomonadota bacterium]
MNHQSTTRHVGIGITLVSGSLLMTEIVLTRLFSVTIGFHFAFLAISVALFGIGAAALVLHLIQHRLTEERTDALLTLGSVLLGATIVASNLILTLVTPNWVEKSGVFVVQSVSTIYLLFFTFCAAAAPFFVGGFVISLAITRYASRIHSLYFFDLLGASVGCLLIIPALNLFGAPVAFVLVAAVAASGGLAFSSKNVQHKSPILGWISAIAICFFVIMAALNPSIGLFEIRRAKGRNLDKLPVEFNQWNSFSMVTVIGENPFSNRRFPGWGLSRRFKGTFPTQKTLLIDMGAMTPLTEFNGDLSSLNHVLHDLSAFAYHIRPDKTKEVCVLGAGGGRDVLSALAAGASHVTAVEINPLIVEEVVRGKFRKFTGGLYHRPDVTAMVDDGRRFIRSTPKKFDLIQISMIDTSAATAAGAYALTESNMYTVEAFDDYFERLKPGGLLTVSAVSAPILDSCARIGTMAWRALRNIGADPLKNVAILSTPWLSRKNHTMRNMIIKKEPFTEGELKVIRETATPLAFKKTYLPDDEPDPKNWVEIILGAESEDDLADRIADWHLDVSPTTDDRPFFFYQNHLKDAWAILGLEDPMQESGVIATGLSVLLKVALIATAMVILFLVLPFIFARKQLRAGKGSVIWDLIYVACLGLGFMYVEISLIQKFTLYLGFPTATLAVVLLVLLGAGAAGSYLFGRVRPELRRKRLALAIALLVAFLVVVWQGGLAAALLNYTSGWDIAGRALITAVLLAPAGLLLGMPLPAGLFSVSQRANSRIPWLWAINSTTSVLGSVSATVFSMHTTISATLWVGTILYFFAFLVSMKVTALSANR